MNVLKQISPYLDLAHCTTHCVFMAYLRFYTPSIFIKVTFVMMCLQTERVTAYVFRNHLDTVRYIHFHNPFNITDETTVWVFVLYIVLTRFYTTSFISKINKKT